MMHDLINLLKELSDNNIYMYLDNGVLKAKAPANTITAEHKSLININKQQLIEHLSKHSNGFNPAKYNDALAQELKAPTSYSQKRLYFLSKLEPGNVEYNMPSVFRVEGHFDEQVAQKCFNLLVARHDIFRTSYCSADNDIWQVVDEDKHVTLQLVDIQNLGGEAQQLRIQQIISEEVNQPFDLERDLMFRTRFIRCSDTAGVLIINTHHIACDGWSMTILFEEFQISYNSLLQGNEPQLAKLQTNFRAYAKWQADSVTEPETERKLDFWLNTLQDAPLTHSLPLDRPRANNCDKPGDVLCLKWNVEKLTRLKQFCAANSLTLFQLLQAVFNLTLSRYAPEKDVVVGFPVASREHPSLKTLIGFFANTLVLRLDCSRSESVIEFLKRAQDTSLRALANNVPFDLIVERLNVARSAAYSPLFQVMFNMDFDRKQDMSQASVMFEHMSVADVSPKFELSLNIWELEDGVLLNYEYNVHLFTEETIRSIAGTYEHILDELMLNPTQDIQQLNLLSRNAREDMLKQQAATRRPFSNNAYIDELITQQAEKTPNATALTFEDSSLSYAQLEAQSNQLAHYLVSQGIQSGERVGVCMERSVQMVIALLGIVKSGGAYVPLDPQLPHERLSYMATDAGVRFILTHTATVKRFNYGDCTVLNLSDGVLLQRLEQQLQITPSIERPGSHLALAYVIYTSGSTGKPKGVLCGHQGLVNRLQWMQSEYQLDATDKVLQKTPYFFDVSVWEFFWPLMVGAQIVIAKPDGHKSPAYLSEVIKSAGITVLHFVPSMLKEMLFGGEWQSCKTVRQVFCSGEVLDKRLVQSFFKTGTQSALHNLYGPTEASIDVSYWRCEANSSLSEVPIGYPISNTQLYIVDEHGQLLPKGAVGELCIGGVGLALGYLNRQELMVEKFIADPFSDEPGARLYRTGDLARLQRDGYLIYLGRIDNQVKIRGLRIELGEIEAAIASYEGIKEAVAAVQHEQQVLQGFVTLSDDLSTSQLETLRLQLFDTLPEYMVPTRLNVLEAMPVSKNGKLDRSQLPLGADTSLSKELSPRSELEQKLCDLWAKELDVEHINITDNYFLKGGNSISVLQLVEKMRTSLNFLVNHKDIFRFPSIRQLVDNCQSQTSDDTAELLKVGHDKLAEFKQSIVSHSNARDVLSDNFEDVFPLSKIQQSMVYLSLARPQEPLYHDQFPFFVRWPDFDAVIFKKTIQLLVKKHPILRTSVDYEHFDDAVQIVHKFTPCNVDITDITGLAKHQQQSFIASYCSDDLQDKFLKHLQIQWRLAVFKVSAEDYCLILSFQHAILDGWSVAALSRELLHIFDALHQKGSCDSDVLQSSYKDYVALSYAQEVTQKYGEFWQEYLAGAERTRLPFNYTGHPISEQLGMLTVRKTLDSDFISQMQLVCRHYNCTLKELLLTTHLYVLMLTSGDKDLVTGLVTHDRPSLPDTEKVLGCYLNTLPLRVTLNSKTNIVELLKHVKESALGVQQHNLFLGDITRFSPKQAENVNPFFDTLFNFVEFPMSSAIKRVNLEQSELSSAIQGAEMTNTLFDMEVHKYGDELVNLQLKFSPRYFAKSEVNTWLMLFVNTITSLFALPKVLRPELVQTEAMLQEPAFNNTEVSYDEAKPLHLDVESQATKTPHSVAIICEQHSCTYQELNARANRIARALLACGVESGQFIGLNTSRSIDMVASMLAVLKIGAIYVPIDPAYPQARQQAIADSARLQLVLSEADTGLAGTRALLINKLELAQYSDLNLALPVDSKQLAYVIYTSGSTGKPKGVPIAHHSVRNLISAVNKRFNISHQDSVLCLTSISFDLSVYDIFGLLSVGGKVVLTETEHAKSPDVLTDLIAKHKITLWNTVPSTLVNFVSYLQLSEQRSDLDSLRIALLSGDWIPVSLPDSAAQHLPNMKVISLGGATEGTVWSNFYEVDAKLMLTRLSVPYGKPLDNNRFYILDENQNPLPPGVVGELYIGGVGVAHGYHNDEEKTAAAFWDDPFATSLRYKHTGKMYKTGDLGRLLPDGNMEFLGRIDNQVKLRGFRVELGEIEAVIARHPNVSAVIAVLHSELNGAYADQQLVAYIVASKPLDEILSEVKQSIQSELPQYMMPSSFMSISALPLSINGKVDRSLLPKLQPVEKPTEQVISASTDTERKLVEIWRKYLRVDDISVHDNFFEIGGNSLIATRLVMDLKKTFATDYPITIIFEYMTIHTLGNHIDTTERVKSRIQNSAVADSEVEQWKI